MVLKTGEETFKITELKQQGQGNAEGQGNAKRTRQCLVPTEIGFLHIL
jgi:hypothetical protein